jgi:hypothetical protein
MLILLSFYVISIINVPDPDSPRAGDLALLVPDPHFQYGSVSGFRRQFIVKNSDPKFFRKVLYLLYVSVFRTYKFTFLGNKIENVQIEKGKDEM